MLGGAQFTEWTKIRAASEALKGAIYTYAASADPYDGSRTADLRFDEECEKIAEEIEDLLGVLETKQTAASAPTAPFASPSEYIDRRVRKQVAYYEENATHYVPIARRLRRSEFALSLLAAVVTAAVGVANKDLFGLGFDFVALTSVLATIGGAILAQIEASRYDFVISTNRTTARRLSDLAPLK